MSQQQVQEPQLTQQERLDSLRQRLRVPFYETVRKEVMLNKNFDLNQLMDPQQFKQFYMYKDPKKEEVLEQIKTETNRVQGVGVLLALPFLYMRIKKRDVMWLLPGIGSIAGFKWYSSKLWFQRMEETQVNDYWRKSKKFEGDLRSVENYIKERKLLEKLSQ